MNKISLHRVRKETPKSLGTTNKGGNGITGREISWGMGERSLQKKRGRQEKNNTAVIQ